MLGNGLPGKSSVTLPSRYPATEQSEPPGDNRHLARWLFCFYNEQPLPCCIFEQAVRHARGYVRHFLSRRDRGCEWSASARTQWGAIGLQKIPNHCHAEKDLIMVIIATKIGMCVSGDPGRTDLLQSPGAFIEWSDFVFCKNTKDKYIRLYYCDFWQYLNLASSFWPMDFGF